MNSPVLNMSAMLQETLHKHTEDTMLNSSTEAVEEPCSDLNAEQSGSGCLSLFTNWPLMSTITVYCIFSLQDMAYAEVACAVLLLRYISVVF